MLLGDKSVLALEVIESEGDATLGKVFLYVNNFRFGYDSHSYDLDSAVENVINYFSAKDVGYKNLFDCPASILFSAYDKAFNEDMGVSDLDEELLSSLSCDEINKFYPNFYYGFSTSDDLDDCYFRLGNYIFDTSTLVLVPDNERLRLYIRDDISGLFTDIVTTRSDFLDLWKGLWDLM